MALPHDILRTISDLARRLSNLESNPQPPNITLSGTASGTFTLEAAGDAGGGDVLTLTATLANPDGKRMVGDPHFTVFKEAVTAADRFPEGANWTNAERRNLIITSWTDWGETDNSNIKLKIMLVNNNAFALEDLLLRVNFRYQLMEATL